MIIFTRQFVFIIFTTALAVLAALQLSPWNLPAPVAVIVLAILATLRLNNRMEDLHAGRYAKLLEQAMPQGGTVRLRLPGLQDCLISAEGLLALSEFCQGHESQWNNPKTRRIDTQGTALHVMVYGETTILNFKVESLSYRIMVSTSDIRELTEITL